MSVCDCEIINIHDVHSVTKTRHETLLSHIVKVASPTIEAICNEVKSFDCSFIRQILAKFDRNCFVKFGVGVGELMETAGHIVQ